MFLFTKLLGDIAHILDTKSALYKLYFDMSLVDIAKNRKEFLNRLHHIYSYFMHKITLQEIEVLKDSVTIEIRAVTSIFECLNAISDYDHILAVSQLAKLKIANKEYIQIYMNHENKFQKNFLWRWIKSCYHSLESKIAIYFHPFFATQAFLLDISQKGEENKLSYEKIKNIEQAPPKTQSDIFMKIHKFCDKIKCKVYILLDKQLLKSPPSLVFSPSTENRWWYPKSANLMVIYEYPEKIEIDKMALSKLAELVNMRTIKVGRTEDFEYYEDIPQLKQKLRFLSVPVDEAVSFGLIINSLEKKSDKEIKEKMREIINDLKSVDIQEKMKNQDN